MAKQKLTPEEKAQRKAERKEKFKEMRKNNDGRWQAVKYFLCMCSAGLIEMITYFIFLKVLPIDPKATIHFLDPVPLSKLVFVSECLSLGLSIIWNFTFNRKFTFKSAKNVPVAMALAFLFYVPFFPFAAWYVPKLTRAWASLGGFGEFLAKGTKMILNGVLEFCWQKFVIYRKSANTAAHKEAATAVDATDAAPEIEHIKDSGVSVEDVTIDDTDTITKG